MAKLLSLIVLLVFSALAAARRDGPPQFTVQGNVVCDTCRVGFETPASTFIHGAVVRLECTNSTTMKPVYTKVGVTDKAGCYKIRVAGDHAGELCEVVLVSSPQPECATIEEGRERARVHLTYDNGIVSSVRYANNLCFLKDYPLATCAQVLSIYQESDD